MKRIPFFTSLTFIVFVFIYFWEILPLPQETLAQSIYPGPNQSPEKSIISTAYPLPQVEIARPTVETVTAPEKLVTFSIDFAVEGLTNKDLAKIQLHPGNNKTSDALLKTGKVISNSSLGNRQARINAVDVPVGIYMLTVEVPANYYREPQGYLFAVTDAGVTTKNGTAFKFKVIPPSQQSLPPCRNIQAKTDINDELITVLPTIPQQEVCKAEGVVDLVSPRSQRDQLKVNTLTSSSLLIGSYSYAGPKTTQDNTGVWGRNRVVDTSVVHDNSTNQFVAERVYANFGSNWIEAGWSEDSWKPEGQYLYVSSAGVGDVAYYQYPLSPGSVVRTQIYYDQSINKWKALYYIGNNQWAVLREEAVGFSTADNAYNRAEVYSANGIKATLPASLFDEGYLLLNGVWTPWDTQFAAYTEESRDLPLIYEPITKYYKFIVRSPTIFLSLINK